MIKIPNKINILGTDYKIKQVSNVYKESLKYFDEEKDNTDIVGCVTTKHCIILLYKLLPLEVKKSVLIHEILEAINDVLSLHLNHDNIDRLENSLYQVIKNNPKVF